MLQVAGAKNRRQSRQRGGFARLATVVIAAVVATIGLVAAQPPQSAAALNPADFQPGYIIDDAKFFDGNAMSEAAIQAFLNSQVAACQNDRCLINGGFPSYDKPRSAMNSGAEICAPYDNPRADGQMELAAAIIYKAQKACGISAKVLLVTLQKEQALITSAAPGIAALNRAMGYACPDTAPCAPTTLGFFNQVYKAAWQFKVYKLDNSYFRYNLGPETIQWHPNAACGSTVVDIKNYATAALYNYTPYQPNAAAMASYPRTGDGCSSYGNRNFWFLYNNWFGPTVGPIIPTERVSTSDRYNTALDISKRYFSPGVPAVYVANGENFPDALSAVPVAAAQGAPLLLVSGSTAAASIVNEIVRLKPAKIVVVGGPSAIPDSVVAQVKAALPTAALSRATGVDRYQTSIQVGEALGAMKSGRAYIATGANYPDALSAAAAAGYQDAPLLLVDGAASVVHPAIADALARWGVTSVTIVGGPNAVSAAMQASIDALPNVSIAARHSGSDRYDTSVKVNSAVFGSFPSAFVATGANFADGLTGGAVAGRDGTPLYLSLPDCAPRGMISHMQAGGATKAILLGGTAALSDRVLNLIPC
ncbi:putative cell wall binding repeat protein [Homoserinimonas aerilata]|uniref:Putative cell wall binding repeat protein n=1 Tax=Homoserinimonas aerilata TaxID=1162970 RepID=A0A542YKQ6_9MICO|nr:cell wall-binding repeat-containing protein [Homoserinimonas aerilata]TQL48658.1 putative cell wall binding repeat protein [Homoserinimonas aerilata]